MIVLVLVESLHKGIIFPKGPLLILHPGLIRQPIMQLIRINCNWCIRQVVLHAKNGLEFLICVELRALATPGVGEEIGVLGFSWDWVAVDVFHYPAAEAIKIDLLGSKRVAREE